MNNMDKQAVAEVLEILRHSENEITEKIPQKFMNFLEENEDKDYKVNIDFTKENWDNGLKKETKAILALIYRDYIVDKEEHDRLLKEAQMRKEKEEQENKEKYSYDNLFKNRKTVPEEEIKEENTQLIEVKEEPWYKKIWKKIISLFGKK